MRSCHTGCQQERAACLRCRGGFLTAPGDVTGDGARRPRPSSQMDGKCPVSPEAAKPSRGAQTDIRCCRPICGDQGRPLEEVALPLSFSGGGGR